MNVIFHLHTPPARAVANTFPARFEPAEAVPYIRIDGGSDPHLRLTHQVVDRAATPTDVAAHPAAWALFQAEMAAAAKAKAEAQEPTKSDAK